MCVCQEVLGEDVADTWEGSGILFKTKATVATATREMALQQLQTAIELARRSGFEADEVQKALDASLHMRLCTLAHALPSLFIQHQSLAT